VIDVGGLYFYLGKSGSKKQKSVMYKLKVIGYDADHEWGEGKNKKRAPAFHYTDVTEYDDGETPWEDEFIPMQFYTDWRAKMWSTNETLYNEYKGEEALWLKEREKALSNAGSTLDPAAIAEAAAETVVANGANTQRAPGAPVHTKKKKTRKSKVRSIYCLLFGCGM
jgi:hypothetical protein